MRDLKLNIKPLFFKSEMSKEVIVVVNGDLDGPWRQGSDWPISGDECRGQVHRRVEMGGRVCQMLSCPSPHWAHVPVLAGTGPGTGAWTGESGIRGGNVVMGSWAIRRGYKRVLDIRC